MLNFLGYIAVLVELKRAVLGKVARFVRTVEHSLTSDSIQDGVMVRDLTFGSEVFFNFVNKEVGEHRQIRSRVESGQVSRFWFC